MIIFAFSLAFFLGREVTLSDRQKSKKTDASSLSSTLKSSTSFYDHQIESSFDNKKAHKQREKVKKYKKTLITEKPIKDITRDKTQEVKQLKTEMKEPNTVYALFVAGYGDKESATEKSTQLKLRFPKWEIFFKRTEEAYKVYIGPFKLKESAENFLKELQKNSEFSTVTLEKI